MTMSNPESLLWASEIQLLEYCIEGGTIERAPGALSLREREVKELVQLIYAKLNARSIEHAVAQLGKRGLLMWPMGEKRRIVLPDDTCVDMLVCIGSGQSIDEIRRKEFPAAQVYGALKELWDGFAIDLELRQRARLVYLACYHEVYVARDPLTIHERRVMRLRARGFTVSEVAEMLGASESTVNSHSRAIFIKLGASSIANAVKLMPEPVPTNWLSRVA